MVTEEEIERRAWFRDRCIIVFTAVFAAVTMCFILDIV